MALIIKDILASDSLQEFINKVNFNFDQVQIHGGGPAGSSGGIGGPGLIGSPGINGTNWHVTDDLNVYVPITTFQNGDLILLTKPCTYNLTSYIKGDIFRVAVVGLVVSIALIGNIKPDNVVTPSGTTGIFETIYLGSNVLYHRNSTEMLQRPILLSTVDSTISNPVMDEFQSYLDSGAVNKSAAYVYGNDTIGGGRLSFMYGEGSVGFLQTEISNAPYIQATINANKFSLLINSSHNLRNTFNDNFTITDGITDFIKIDPSRNISFLLGASNKLQINDALNTRVTITDTGFVGIGESTPTEYLEIGTGGNIAFKTDGWIKSVGQNNMWIDSTGLVGFGHQSPIEQVDILGNLRFVDDAKIYAGTLNENQIIVHSNGNIMLNGSAFTIPYARLSFGNSYDEIKFEGQNARITGPDVSTVYPVGMTIGTTHDFIVTSGQGIDLGLFIQNAPSMMLLGGNAGAGYGGDVYVRGGFASDVNKIGNTYLGYDKDTSNKYGSTFFGCGMMPGVTSGQSTFNGKLRVVNDRVIEFSQSGSGYAPGVIYGNPLYLRAVNGNSGITLYNGYQAFNNLNRLYGDNFVTANPASLSSVVGETRLLELWASNPSLRFVSTANSISSIVFSSQPAANTMLMKIAVDSSSSFNDIYNGVRPLRVNSEVGSGTTLWVENHNTTINDHIFRVVSTRSNSATNSSFIGFYNTLGSYLGGIKDSLSGPVFDAPSDERLKTNIVDTNSVLDKINKIKVRDFKWKKNTSEKVTGVIAQELEEVFPEYVNSYDEENAEKELVPGDAGFKYKSVQLQSLIPHLIKANQELYAELIEMKKQIEELTNKIK